MLEFIMQYDLDDTGKMISARRKEKLVRCKDCFYGDFYTAVDGNRYCYCTKHSLGERKEDDFCSRAERRPDE